MLQTTKLITYWFGVALVLWLNWKPLFQVLCKFESKSLRIKLPGEPFEGKLIQLLNLNASQGLVLLEC